MALTSSVPPLGRLFSDSVEAPGSEFLPPPGGSEAPASSAVAVSGVAAARH